MATRDPGGSPPTTDYRYCANCGAQATGDPFCPSCGTQMPLHAYVGENDRIGEQDPVSAAGSADNDIGPAKPPMHIGSESAIRPAPDDPTLPLYERPFGRVQPPDGQIPVPANRRRRLPLVIGAVVVMLAAAGGIAAALLLTGKSTAPTSYSKHVAAAFAPVTTSNRTLSDALAKLHGSDTTAGRVAVQRAQTATSAAHGALDALAAPSGSQQLSSQARQALDREDSYLGAVSSALANPSSPSVSQLQALAGNLTSSLDAVGAPLAGASQSVSGADNLTNWAQHQRSVSSNAQTNSGQTSSAPPITPAPTPAPSGFTSCDANISVSGASCEFANNVFYEYWSSDRASQLSVWSPPAQSFFPTSCNAGSDTVVCTNNVGAQIDFPVSAVDAYSQSQADAYAAGHQLGP